MKLDRVTTIAIGNPGLSDADLRAMLDRLAKLVTTYGGTIYAQTIGGGIGSDDDRLGNAEPSAILLCGNVTDLPNLRIAVARCLRDWDMSSACFATDPAHEPVWNTPNGTRPTN